MQTETATVEEILKSEERKKTKRTRPRESQTGIRVGNLTIWKRSFEIITGDLIIIAEFKPPDTHKLINGFNEKTFDVI